jgi:signal transduction histidine kinase
VVQGDLTRLAQVVSNLVNNAVKYTPRGGHIDLAARVDGEEAVVEVSDNGAGIAAGLLPHVFDLFAQGDGARDKGQGGLGIGLWLVRKLVEMHGGRIEARSAGPDQGSTFTVRLPLSAP